MPFMNISFTRIKVLIFIKARHMGFLDVSFTFCVSKDEAKVESIHNVASGRGTHLRHSRRTSTVDYTGSALCSR